LVARSGHIKAHLSDARTITTKTMKHRIPSTARLSFPLASALAAMLAGPTLHAQSGNWNYNGTNATSLLWHTAASWITDPAGQVPGNFPGDVINFNNNISSTRSIVIDGAVASRTAGIINYQEPDDGFNNRYWISSSNGGTLTMQNTGMADAEINVYGSQIHRMQAPLVLNSNLVVNAVQPATHYLMNTSSVTGAGSITKTGPGLVAIRDAGWVGYGGDINVQEGSFSFRSKDSVPSSDSITFAANTVLGFGRLFDATNGWTIAEVVDALQGTLPASMSNVSIHADTMIGMDVMDGSVDLDFNIPLPASSRGLVMLGAGKAVALNADNSPFTGNIVVRSWEILVKNNNSLGSGSGTTTVEGGQRSAIVLSSLATPLNITENFYLKGNVQYPAGLFNNEAQAHAVNGNMDVSSDTNNAQIGSSNNSGSLTVNSTITGTMTNGARLELGGNSTNTENKLTGLIGHNGGLLKNNFGTWKLTNANNTYPGGTTVTTGGILIAAATGALGTGDVTVTGGVLQIDALNAMSTSKTLALPTDTTAWLTLNADQTVGELIIGAFPMADGEYTDADGFISGPGTLTVAAPSGSAYDTWAAINAPGSDPDEDLDGDGVSNAVEFVLGGDKDANDIGKLPLLATDGTNVTFTFVRDQASIDPKTALLVETSSDLVTWDSAPSPYTVPDTAVANNPGVTVVKGSPTGKDTVTLTVPQDSATKFARLKVVITP